IAPLPHRSLALRARLQEEDQNLQDPGVRGRKIAPMRRSRIVLPAIVSPQVAVQGTLSTPSTIFTPITPPPPGLSTATAVVETAPVINVTWTPELVSEFEAALDEVLPVLAADSDVEESENPASISESYDEGGDIPVTGNADTIQPQIVDEIHWDFGYNFDEPENIAAEPVETADTTLLDTEIPNPPQAQSMILDILSSPQELQTAPTALNGTENLELATELEAAVDDVSMGDAKETVLSTHGSYMKAILLEEVPSENPVLFFPQDVTPAQQIVTDLAQFQSANIFQMDYEHNASNPMDFEQPFTAEDMELASASLCEFDIEDFCANNGPTTENAEAALHELGHDQVIHEGSLEHSPREPNPPGFGGVISSPSTYTKNDTDSSISAQANFAFTFRAEFPHLYPEIVENNLDFIPEPIAVETTSLPIANEVHVVNGNEAFSGESPKVKTLESSTSTGPGLESSKLKDLIVPVENSSGATEVPLLELAQGYLGCNGEEVAIAPVFIAEITDFDSVLETNNFVTPQTSFDFTFRTEFLELHLETVDKAVTIEFLSSLSELEADELEDNFSFPLVNYGHTSNPVTTQYMWNFEAKNTANPTSERASAEEETLLSLLEAFQEIVQPDEGGENVQEPIPATDSPVDIPAAIVVDDREVFQRSPLGLQISEFSQTLNILEAGTRVGGALTKLAFKILWLVIQLLGILSLVTAIVLGFYNLGSWRHQQAELSHITKEQILITTQIMLLNQCSTTATTLETQKTN
ncbi:hypothetical protein RUND412_006257, partial [Rhizina undulata]